MAWQEAQQVSASEVVREFESRMQFPRPKRCYERLYKNDGSYVNLWTQDLEEENYAIYRQHSKDLNQIDKIGEWHGWELTQEAYRTIFEQHANPSLPVPPLPEIIILTREEDGKYVVWMNNGLWGAGDTREEALQMLEEEKKEFALYMIGPVEEVRP